MIKAFVRRTLVRRVSVALILVFAALYLVLTAYAIVTLRSSEQDGQYLRMEAEATLRALGEVSQPGEARAVALSVEALSNAYRGFQQAPGTVLVQVWDRHESQMVYSTPQAGSALLPGTPNGHTQQVIGGSSYGMFQGDTPRWSLRFAEPVMASSSTWQWALSGLMPWMLIAFPCMLLPISLVVSHGLRPLQRLSDEIASRSVDDLSAVRGAPAYEELKPLVASLDHLLARLRHKIQRERAFVQDAAHELRTPMAVISAQAHVLATSGEVHRHEAAQQLDRAIARGSHLIEQMLQLARVDHELSPRVSEVDVARLARQVLAQRAPAAMARSMELSLDAPDLLRHALDVQALHSVLHNLVDNAIRYGNTGGRIVVALRGEAGALLLSVADDGPGIPMQDREMVFERFYRGADHDASGSGLGLAIVKQAVARMFGTVTVQTGLDGRGCCFAVSIPVDRTPA